MLESRTRTPPAYLPYKLLMEHDMKFRIHSDHPKNSNVVHFWLLKNEQAISLLAKTQFRREFVFDIHLDGLVYKWLGLTMATTLTLNALGEVYTPQQVVCWQVVHKQTKLIIKRKPTPTTGTTAFWLERHAGCIHLAAKSSMGITATLAILAPERAIMLMPCVSRSFGLSLDAAGRVICIGH